MRLICTGASLIIVGVIALGGCGQAGTRTPPDVKSPFETARVNDATVEIGSAELNVGDTRTSDDDWVEAETKVFLAARPYTKPELRGCIENALNATISKAWLHYDGEVGKTGDNIDYVGVGVFKKKRYRGRKWS
jgi:hypothetical protein